MPYRQIGHDMPEYYYAPASQHTAGITARRRYRPAALIARDIYSRHFLADCRIPPSLKYRTFRQKYSFYFYHATARNAMLPVAEIDDLRQCFGDRVLMREIHGLRLPSCFRPRAERREI